MEERLEQLYQAKANLEEQQKEIIMTTSTTTKTALGFRNGLNQLKMGDYKSAVAEIWVALGINNRNSFARYAAGRTELKVTQAQAVEVVFNRYGVTTNIWGV